MSAENVVSTTKLQRLGRWLGMTGFVATVVIFIFAWAERGYAARLRITREGYLGPLAFSPTGETLAVHSVPSGLLFGWSLDSKAPASILFLSARDGNELQPSLPANVYTETASFSPDGKRLAVLERTGGDKLQLVVYDWQSRARIASQEVTYVGQTGSGRPEGQVAIQFSPDSNFLVWCGKTPNLTNGVAWSWSSVVGVLDLVTGKERFTLEKTWGSVISPDSKLLATIDDLPPSDYGPKGTLKLWNAESGDLVTSVPIANRASHVPPEFSPDGRWVTFCGWGPKTEVFDASTGQRVWEHQGVSARFLPKSPTLMLVSGFEVQFWDTDTWQPKSSFWIGDPAVSRPVVIPNSSQVAVVVNHSGRYWPSLRWLARVGRFNTLGTGQLCILDATNGSRRNAELHEINPLVTRESTYGTGEAWSPDGTSVAFANHGQVIAVWDLPPQPSYVAPGFATALLVAAGTLLPGLVRRSRKSVPLSDHPAAESHS